MRPTEMQALVQHFGRGAILIAIETLENPDIPIGKPITTEVSSANAR